MATEENTQEVTEDDAFGKQLTTRKRGRFWRTFGMGVGVLAIAGGLYFGLTQSGRDTVQLVKSGVETGIAVRQNPNLIFDHAGGDHANILLIGRDTDWKETKVFDPTVGKFRRGHVHQDTKARSDTMIVISLDKARNTIRMISLPRDAKVYIPHNDVETGVNKLNAAHAFGGPALLLQTLHDELGLTIQHYAVIKFEGFKALIDQVGGIEVKVDGALKRDKHGKLYRGDLDYDDNYGNLHIHLKPGVQTLDGLQAHNYVRFRMDIEGDPGRIRRQQDVMRALAKKVMNQPPYKIPGLIKEVRKQFETSLSDEEIGSAAFFARGLGNATKIQPMTLFGSYGRRGSVLLNKPKNEKLLTYIFGSTFDPTNFLQRSPTTEGDEIGSTNDTNPGARQVMIEAGILDPKSKPPSHDITKVPVRTDLARN